MIAIMCYNVHIGFIQFTLDEGNMGQVWHIDDDLYWDQMFAVSSAHDFKIFALWYSGIFLLVSQENSEGFHTWARLGLDLDWAFSIS